MFLSTKGKEHNSAPKSSNSGITQAVTQPNIRLTQPKNALTQFTGNYVVCTCRKSVEKKTLVILQFPITPPYMRGYIPDNGWLFNDLITV